MHPGLIICAIVLALSNNLNGVPLRENEINLGFIRVNAGRLNAVLEHHNVAICRLPKVLRPSRVDAGAYKAIYITSGCPTAVCDKDCDCRIVMSNGCPVYFCNESFLREPCQSNSDCKEQGVCTNSICHYATQPSSS
ncbi:hypothetical protein M514_01071 [Trichuris suis]|uniref:EB domain-containing protein n=1 Tax=Trichuris suis TaxID=68888 RepID=A0A085MXD5_9BILA|nr:hypothetical protein M513_01071 [Trichuris suis]KFD61881.1 hypothetical protein M514_01071 [Trichuris suis]